MNGDCASEYGAGRLICSALNARSFIRTGADSSASDGVIYMDDGREIQLEVTRTMMADFAQATKEAERAGHQISLTPGSGEWLALLSPQTSISEFSRLPADVIMNLASRQGIDLDSPSLIMPASLNQFDVVALSGAPSSNDVLRFHIITMSSSASSFISTHPDVIADFATREIRSLQEAARMSGKKSKFERLVDRALDNSREPHFAFIVKDTLDTGLRFALWQIFNIHGVFLPEKEIELPSGVKCVWVIRGDYKLGYGYSIEGRWSRHAVSQ